MLLEYKVSNFKSIGKEASLSMEFINSKQNNEDRLNFYEVKDSVYKKVNHTLAILGANASGKSNILESAIAFKYALSNSDDEFMYTPNKFFKELLTTDFDITFYNEDRNAVFNFILKYNNKGVSYEKLSARSLSSSEFTEIYTVDGNKLYLNDDIIEQRLNNKNKDIKQIKQQYLHDYNESKRGYMCFLNGFNKEYKSLNFYRDILDSLFRVVCINVGKKYRIHHNRDGLVKFIENKKDLLLSIIQENIDDSIIDIQYTKEKITIDEDTFDYTDIILTRKSEDGNVLFKINDESDGTERFLYFIPTFLEVLNNGGILLIDEIEQNLHPVLVKKLIDMFKNKDINKGLSQLIFSTHDVSVLDKGVLNVQEVAFSEKRDNETELYYLTDFPIRKSELIRKKYKEGRFGAVPNLVDYLGE